MHKNLGNELYENSYTNPKHFSFGKNWEQFLKKLNKERVEEAERSLITFLGGKENIIDKTFIDIGCGSGLFSLAAYRLGAKKVVSVDIDDFSLSCVTFLHKQENHPGNWAITKGSALDGKFFKSLDTFDIVYSWGVLHHTGDMYLALKNSSTLIHTNGSMYIALYNDSRALVEGTSNLWLKIKKFYNKSPWTIKKTLEILYTSYYVSGLLVNGKNPITYLKNYQSLRGMNFMTDIRDWLGGYPYEYASTETIISYCKSLGLKCLKITKARSIGCNEFLFVKK